MRDVRHHRHAIGRHGIEELERRRQHDEVGKGATRIEQHQRGYQQRPGQALLVLVQARAHEGPQLVQDHRHADEQRHEEGQLQRRDERTRHLGGNQVRTGRHALHQRLGQLCIQMVRHRYQGKQHQQQHHDGPQQARTQLDQVGEQALFDAALGGRIGVSYGHAARSWAPAGCRWRWPWSRPAPPERRAGCR